MWFDNVLHQKNSFSGNIEPKGELDGHLGMLCPRSTVLDGFLVEGGGEWDGTLLVIEGERVKAVEVEIE
ncbi:hypothetical protein [Chitinophaga rhizosphaerae]|uniref:hypothetical protein n=1 Tax=Chitinophaga rhizosphaerae TaxID=1864947 RepID=UPI000F80EA11|nr:hypothetical protein [Chitinophaga rhizosphaerae]